MSDHDPWDIIHSMHDCSICSELWRQLATKTAEYARLRDQQENAAIEGKVEFFKDLDSEVQKADRDRADARQAIADHKRMHQ